MFDSILPNIVLSEILIRSYISNHYYPDAIMESDCIA